MPKRDERLARVKCPACGKEVSARVPKDGDGSAYLPVWHRGRDYASSCPGRFDLVDTSDLLREGHDHRGALREGRGR